jgi:hypothetical protein
MWINNAEINAIPRRSSRISLYAVRVTSKENHREGENILHEAS